MTGAPFFVVLLIVAALWFPEYLGAVISGLSIIAAMFITGIFSGKLGRQSTNPAMRRFLDFIAYPFSLIGTVWGYIQLNTDAASFWLSAPAICLWVCLPWALAYSGALLDRWLPSFADDPWVNPFDDGARHG